MTLFFILFFFFLLPHSSDNFLLANHSECLPFLLTMYQPQPTYQLTAVFIRQYQIHFSRSINLPHIFTQQHLIRLFWHVYLIRTNVQWKTFKIWSTTIDQLYQILQSVFMHICLNDYRLCLWWTCFTSCHWWFQTKRKYFVRLILHEIAPHMSNIIWQ